VIVAEDDAETALVFTAKVALVLPEATVTEDGTVTAEELSVREITLPLEVAGPVNVIVPWVLLPPITDEEFRLTEFRAGGDTVSVEVLLVPLSVAVIVAEAEAETAVVAMANVAVVLPAATVTEPGTVAAALLLDNETAIPPEGAAAARVTVPWELLLPVTVVGLRLSELNAGGFMVRVAV